MINAPAEKPSREAILDKALELAESSSWEAVRLHDVAMALQISLDDIRVHFRQKDDLAEAWFDRADSAMLTDAAGFEYRNLSGRDRIHRSIMVWLGALAAHRHITRDMLLYKLEPGHIHFQALGLTRISRTVQWILEAANSDSRWGGRIFEEIGTTSIYLSGVTSWLFDNSAGSEKTSRLLSRLLSVAENARGFLRPVFA